MNPARHGFSSGSGSSSSGSGGCAVAGAGSHVRGTLTAEHLAGALWPDWGCWPFASGMACTVGIGLDGLTICLRVAPTQGVLNVVTCPTLIPLYTSFCCNSNYVAGPAARWKPRAVECSKTGNICILPRSEAQKPLAMSRRGHAPSTCEHKGLLRKAKRPCRPQGFLPWPPQPPVRPPAHSTLRTTSVTVLMPHLSLFDLRAFITVSNFSPSVSIMTVSQLSYGRSP